MEHGGQAKVMYHKSNRYYSRKASRIVETINSFSQPVVTKAIGTHGEHLVFKGFAVLEFVLKGENVNEYRGKKWLETNHDLDFIFERDGFSYGVEVKNTLGYIEKEELVIKTRLCQFLGITPVFAVRMLPKSWMIDIVHDAGGFVLIMKYQMYPPVLSDLAKSVKEELGIPVDSPPKLLDGTMRRFEKWHNKRRD